MRYHILDKITCKIQVIDGKPFKPATTLLSNIVVDKLYSYIVYNKKQNEYIVAAAYSQIDKYNTILKEEAICEISNMLITNNSDKKRVLGFKQPPLELYIHLAEPLVNDLALQMHRQWHIELEDLQQLCYLSICKLYNKGYYLHPKLISTTFRNDVLKSIRSERNAPEIKSIDSITTDDNNCTIYDIIADEYAEDEIYATITKEDDKYILENMQDLIVSIVGQRRYDQLVREYGNKYTTTASAREVNSIKHKLKQMGVNITWFDGTTINTKRSN